MGISSQLMISGGHPSHSGNPRVPTASTDLLPLKVVTCNICSLFIRAWVKICKDCKDLWGEQMHSLRKTHLTRRDCHRFKTIKFCCTLGVKAVTSPENAHLPISLNTFPVWVLSYLNRMQHARQHAGQHLPFVYLSVHSKG